jgi:CHAT domain-containing protein/tetratricopeptide (TPR) repeat protein
MQALYAARVGNVARSRVLLAQALAACPPSPEGTLLKARCCRNVAYSLLLAGCPAEALDEYDQALSFYLAPVAGPQEIAECCSDSGTVARVLGRGEDALRRFEEAWHLLQDAPDATLRRGQYLINTSTALADMGQYEDALARLTEAEGYFRNPSNKGHESVACMMNMAVTLSNLGLYEKALEKYDQAGRLLEGAQDADKVQASLRDNAGIVLTEIGRYDEAIECYREALNRHLTVPDSEQQQAGCYINLGRTLEQIGQHDEAIKQIRRALRLSEHFQIHPIVARKCWFNLAGIYFNSGQYEQAVDCLGKARDRWTHWELSWLSGRLFAARNVPGDQERALEAYLKATETLGEGRSRLLATEHRVSFLETGGAVSADFADFLIERQPAGAAAAWERLGQRAGENSRETDCRELAFYVIEQGKGRGLTDQLCEKAVLKGIRPDARLLARDRSVSRQISKLTSLRNDLPETETERRGDLTAKIDELQRQRNLVEVEIKKAVAGGYVAPEFRRPMDMAKELPQGTAVLQYSIGEEESWLLILTREGVTAHKLPVYTRALPELLPRQQAALTQLLEARKTRKDKIGLEGLVELARARTEDFGKRESERQNLMDANTEKAILEHLGQVVLPDSALSQLRQGNIHHLLVIPDGALHYVPFAMLRVRTEKDATQYLIEQYAISYTPAMTTLETIRKQKIERQRNRKGPRREVLAFANPAFGSEPVVAAATTGADDMVTRLRSFRGDYYKDSGLKRIALPETEQEAMRVASLFGPPQQYRTPSSQRPEGTAVVYSQRGASEDQVERLLEATGEKSQRPGWRYLLFSTHGLADVRNGMLSCLALSEPEANSQEDGYLQAQEVMGLDLDTDLVMLSACQTGLGRLSGGEGLVGLTGSFFYAGAESVCASLWQVPSGPTSQMVTEFFKGLKDGKVSRAEALRQAQLKVMRGGRTPDGKSADYSSPFCWAAWGLYGEWEN